MPPGIEKNICKMNIDLWMHQNTLMWTRLQTLWLVRIPAKPVSDSDACRYTITIHVGMLNGRVYC